MSDTRKQIAERIVPRKVRTVYEGSCGIDYDIPRLEDAEFRRTLIAMSEYAAAVLEEMAEKYQRMGDVAFGKWLRARAAQERER